LDDAMRRWLSPRSVIVGVGNADRGDDAFGPAVIRLLAGRLPPEALVDAGPCPENYLGVIVQHHPGVVLILDAGELGEPPGSLTLCGPRDLVGGGISCHAGNLALLCAWIENLTGAACHLLLAQAARVSGYADREADRAAGPHIGLSPPVEAAARRAADAILAAGQFKAPCDFGGQHVS
jgi:hydrogenase 3 maturation protease